ncbi:hypothetical protein ACHAXT_000967 [Thalassiosira profunda]
MAGHFHRYSVTVCRFGLIPAQMQAGHPTPVSEAGDAVYEGLERCRGRNGPAGSGRGSGRAINASGCGILAHPGGGPESRAGGSVRAGNGAAGGPDPPPYVPFASVLVLGRWGVERQGVGGDYIP